MLAWQVWPRPAVVITHLDTGRRIASLPLAPGEPLELRYVHSIYRQPAVEEFAVRPEGGLQLVRLRSPSVPVLEYYARPEPIRPAPEGGYEIRVSDAPSPAVNVLASRLGGRTVSYAGHVVRLYEAAGDGARVALEVRAVPLIARWTSPQ